MSNTNQKALTERYATLKAVALLIQTICAFAVIALMVENYQEQNGWHALGMLLMFQLLFTLLYRWIARGFETI